ncbi:hypothetical protein EV702DRAFT_1080530 [Suillus placidus]|uniref:Uncharacterized protein n=1 Tax=Suillus placidus TaxID=48579 RepID=A0A9P7A1J1_9AGAM|nr:hypothetical protein EV702DRAFT_1080530 [Suillus placidus]
MPIHQAFHRDMPDAFNLDRAGVWFSLCCGAFDPISLQIVALFDDINTRRDHYEVINDEPTRESFPKVVERIKTLHTHARSRDLSSIFPEGAALTVSYQGTNFELETLFDLVGWIFSVTGKTPDDATPANYYYPLVILYSQWCRTLCAKIEKEPQMVQITWFPQESIKRVCLGSNLDRPKKLRKDAARLKRFTMLHTDGLAEEAELVDHYTGDGGQLIGHCAETFPMLFVKSLGNTVTMTDVKGVAVKPFAALADGLPDKFAVPNTHELRTTLLEDPCDNCKVVLPRLGHINLDNFSIHNL